MFAIRNSLTSTSRLSGVIARSYHNTIVCTPPTVKISTAEKLFSLFCIGAAILGTPMYMAPNFKNYNKRKA